MSKKDSIKSENSTKDNNNIKDLMKIEYTYPEPDDDEFQNKVYTKREFYYHKIPGRDELKDYRDVKEYRDQICSRKFALQPQQSFLSNFINPDTPYKGALIFHGTGTGKCQLPDTIVKLNDKFLTLEQIWRKYKTNEITDNENGIWSKINNNLFVDSVNENTNKIITGKVKSLYRQKVNEQIREIYLENGLFVKITKIHKLLSEDGWTNNLKEGMYIAIPKKIKNYINGTNDIKINNLTKSTKEKGDLKFIRIERINEMDYNGYVYDLEIEKYHNYIANGIFCHNTCAGIAIAERFKDMIKKYNTKIYVLVSGPLIKENWKSELLKCTGETYLKKHDESVYISKAERNKAKKNALNVAMKYYRFMSYRSFYKKVLGEKIVEKVKTNDNRTKTVYRKTKEGYFERDIAIDRIYNLDNSLIIIDEAHNLTGNAYGEALLKIIKNSTNFKIVLLTETQMKNLAEDIIQLINFIRPPDAPLKREKIFTSEQYNYLIDFKPNGLKYLKDMSRGYVSYLRGADPLTFAKRVEKGTIPKGLLFTKVIQCTMKPFQREVYDRVVTQIDDSLERKSEAVANFVFPGLGKDRKKIIGHYGTEGISILKDQIQSYYELLNKEISKQVLKVKDGDVEDNIYLSENNRISGNIMKYENLENFSVKFYRALTNISKLVWGIKGAKTAFIYSKLVKVGIEVFQEILLQNGYLEYDENPTNYKINSDTICYYCGHTYKEHQERKFKKTVIERIKKNSNKSSDKYEEIGQPPYHDFHPATFLSVTGGTSEESLDVIPEDKQQIIFNVFNHIDNKEGKHIKFILGSQVMNEGISLKNVSEVHILDVYFNLGRVDQVIGRAIRHCSHYGITNENNKYPEVKVYKYVVTVEKRLSTEEELYKKAEYKYMLVKKVERALKEVAIDCPLNRNGNIFPEELKEYKDCVDPGKPSKSNQKICPAICDYTDCAFKCAGAKLNKLWWDNSKKMYRNVSKNNLDYSTFTNTLAKSEIEYVKNKVKELYKIKYVYTLKEIINYVKNTYTGEKRDLFDDFFVFKALDELIPVSENDFNNYKDTIFDKFNRAGYLIYVDKYYIFQPFDENEDVPMYYRSNFDKPMQNKLTLHGYLQNTIKFKEDKKMKKPADKDKKEFKKVSYDFEGTLDYYNSRAEFEYVGIIDKESARRKNKDIDELQDVFKIREKREKVLEKKRGTGIPSLTGAVCSTSKDRKYLEKISKKLEIKVDNNKTRSDICNKIKERLLFLEKYSTKKRKNKVTYIMIPKNHTEYSFPYNLEDRVKYIVDEIKDKIRFDLDIKVKSIKHSEDGFKNLLKYDIMIKHTNKLNDFKKFLESKGAKLVKGTWIIKVN